MEESLVPPAMRPPVPTLDGDPVTTPDDLIEALACQVICQAYAIVRLLRRDRSNNAMMAEELLACTEALKARFPKSFPAYQTSEVANAKECK